MAGSGTPLVLNVHNLKDDCDDLCLLEDLGYSDYTDLCEDLRFPAMRDVGGDCVRATITLQNLATAVESCLGADSDTDVSGVTFDPSTGTITVTEGGVGYSAVINLCDFISSVTPDFGLFVGG